MTKHPLTDEMCLELSAFTLDIMAEDWAEWHREDMRSAADWQLEQVLIWLKSELASGNYLLPRGWDGHEIDVDDVLYDLKQAMRPQDQQQQENN